MTTFALALGKTFDVRSVTPATDAVAGAITGNRVHLRDGEVCSFIVVKATDAGTTDDLAVDLQEHTAFTAGTTQDLDIITDYFSKSETTLDGDETWTRVSQAAASEIAAVAGTAELQLVWVIEVHANQLAAGFEYVSLNVPDLGATDDQRVTIIPIVSNLNVQRQPENIAAQS
jgi:hypothetical protein